MTRAIVSALALALIAVGCSADGDAVDASVFDYDADADLNLVEGEAIELPFPDTDVRPITYDSPGGPVTGYIALPAGRGIRGGHHCDARHARARG